MQNLPLDSNSSQIERAISAEPQKPLSQGTNSDAAVQDLSKKILENQVSGDVSSHERVITPQEKSDLKEVDAALRPKPQESRWSSMTSWFTSKPVSPLGAAIHPKFSTEKFESVVGSIATGFNESNVNWLFEVAVGNKNLNTYINDAKRKNTPFYQENKEMLDALSHLTYVTQQSKELSALTEKAELLLKRQAAGEVIREDEKISPKEMHLIDSFSHSLFLTLSNLNPILDKIAPDNPSRHTLEQIKTSLSFWDSLTQEAMGQYQEADIIFDTSNLERYTNSGTWLHSRIRTVTGQECYHAAIFHKEFDRSKGVETPLQSHVIGELCTSAMEIGKLSYMEFFRLDVTKLIKDEVLQKLSPADQKFLQAAFANTSYDVHAAMHKALAQDSAIINGLLPQVSLFLGESFPEAKQAALKELPNRPMVCSEFVTYATLITLNKFEEVMHQQFGDQIGAERCLKPLLPTDSSIILHPGNLYALLMKQGVVNRVAPSDRISAVMQTPRIHDAQDLVLSPKAFRAEIKSA